MDLQRLLWGNSSTRPRVPFHYSVLALLPVISSLTITTWFFPQELGYIITGATLVAVAAYGALAYRILDAEIQIQVDSLFFILMGGYWIGLLIHYYYAPHTELLQYILVTPLAVVTTVLVIPALIDGRRETFTMGLTVVAVVVSLIGLGMLWIDARTGVDLYRVGGSVMGIDGIRTISIFHNPNTYGFFMMAGSLAALYTYLARRGALWFGALLLCLLGLLLSEGDAAFVGFAGGAVLVLSGPDRQYGFFGLIVVVIAIYVAIRLGHVGDIMGERLMNRANRWVSSLERLAQDPMLGIGFADTAEEIGEARGPHNSYIYPLLNAGIIPGGLYLGALVYALGQGIRTRWTTWTGFVVGMTVAIFLYMGFESLFLGGLSISSILLGVCLGLLLYPSGATNPPSSRQSLK